MAKLVMTVEEMKDRKAWLKLRNSGLGGSDASVIMGMNPWKSRLALWAEKTGEIEPEELSGNQRVYWGQKKRTEHCRVVYGNYREKSYPPGHDAVLRPSLDAGQCRP